MYQNRTKRGIVSGLLLLLFAAVVVLIPTDAYAQATPERDGAAEKDFYDAINEERTSRGLDELTIQPSMASASLSWTLEMSSGEFLAHADDIVTGTPDGWQKVGENVGRGGTVGGLMNAFMNSEGHRKNLLDPMYTHFGVGVYITDSGVMYTTHRFAALPDGLGAPPATLGFVDPAPAPAPTPAPAPAPAPTPAPAPAPAPAPEPLPTISAGNGGAAPSPWWMPIPSFEWILTFYRR